MWAAISRTDAQPCRRALLLLLLLLREDAGAEQHTLPMQGLQLPCTTAAKWPAYKNSLLRRQNRVQAEQCGNCYAPLSCAPAALLTLRWTLPP
jgi:hypothetical protein